MSKPNGNDGCWLYAFVAGLLIGGWFVAHFGAALAAAGW